MGRALALFLFLLPALAQTLNCDATEVRFDFSAPGPLTFLNGYPVASLAGYLHLLDLGSALSFLPTQVVGETGQAVSCQVRTRNKGKRGVVCGAGNTYCLRLSGVSGSLPLPLQAFDRLLVQVQVVSGTLAVNHAPTPTPIGNLPDNGGLASVGPNSTVSLILWLYLRLDPGDAFPTLLTGGTLTLTYALEGD
ncbi:hypothetical protein [Thermus caliditerrae]|uniref:hypothetical protein n=1 Tax=Thermus caliditerrae TaxID=1330700 RepID=UPI0005706022|nr:hypothetical protein [Thermus caliditerrae]